MSQGNPTDKQATTLAAQFILHGDKTKALKRAFPKSKASKKTQWKNACIIFKLPKVKERIEELKVISKRQSEEEFELTVSDLKRVLDLTMKKGFGTPDKKVKGKIVKGIPANLPAIVSAVKEFNLMDGNHASTKIDHSSSDGTMAPKGFNDFYKKEE